MGKLHSEKVVFTRLLAILGSSPREVIYNTLGHLVKLNLSSLGIELLPAEIGQLTSLQELDLHNNQLSQLSAEIGQLTSLQRLSLHNNQLSQLPTEIGQLTSLQTLSLHDNHLRQLPAEIGQFTSLQGLTLNNNQLSQLPAEFWQLTSLRRLDLDDNQFRQLPVEIGQLTSLQRLSLNNNQLSQLPAEIGQLTSLQNLSLDENLPLLTPPPEIVAQGTQEVLSYLQAIQRKSVKRYEAKLLLVGDGGTGKSSLLRTLQGKEFDVSLASTDGIEVGMLSLPHPSLPGCSLILTLPRFRGSAATSVLPSSGD